MTVDGVARTVIGVMPAGFNLEGKDIQAWMSLALDPANPGDPGFHSLYLIGRLREGVTLGQAQSELDGLLARWAAEKPGAHTFNNTDHRLIMTPLLEERVGSARPAMRVLAWAVVFILLIACANVANLLLARAETRQGEIGLRAVLGADRASLLRQFLIESLLLGGLGGALGLLLAYWGIRGIVFARPESIPRVDEIAFDGRVIGFTLLISFVVSLFVGLPPALHALSGTRSLKDGGQRTTASVARQRLRRGLVVLEVALAVALVIACGLLIRSFLALQKVDPGFKPDHVLSFQLSLPETVYPKPQQVLSFYERLLARLDELPGVEATAAVSRLPPKRDVTAGDTVFESVPVDPQGPPHNVDYWQFATPGYLKVMEIPMVQGRWFTAADTQGTPGVAVINETMAKVFWPGKNPIGQRLRYPFDGMPWLTIIGIARDVKQGGLDVKTGTELYFPFLQSPEATGDAPRSLYVLLRTTGDPMHVAGAVRNEIRRLDATLPAARIRSMEQVISDIQARPRFLMLLVSVFAAVALLLAAVGTYSVLSYSVEQRSREIGVRMALGARPVTVLRMVLIQGAGLVGLGLVLGSAGTVALRLWLASLLFGIEPIDLLTLGSVIVLLTVVAFAACYFPVRRATRIDPLTVLKQE